MTATTTRNPYPALAAALERGDAWVGTGSGAVFGCAADGTAIFFGWLGRYGSADRDAVERYLAAHPTPATW